LPRVSGSAEVSIEFKRKSRIDRASRNESGCAAAAFEGTFLLLIIASDLCAQIGEMEGPEAGARPQAEALIKRVGNDREKLNTACSETKEVVARWTRITLFRL
jgi:hypothetical protein